ncbi:MAG TPA: tyrosine-type recombinase/integrase [Roseococcus sp.]|jgi:integrase|nr:tyrosine-type recombinase/integrase [Roseococcus sp.]
MSFDRLRGAEQLDLFAQLASEPEPQPTPQPNPEPERALQPMGTARVAPEATITLPDEVGPAPVPEEQLEVERSAPALRPSRQHEPFTLPAGPPPNFAALMQWVGQQQNLPESTRHDLRSALRRTAQILHQPPANVLANVSQLNHDLYRHAPAAHGMGHAAFEQLVSRLRRALRLAGWHAPDIKGEGRLSPPWKSFLGHVSPEGLRAGLRGLARYCDQRGLSPADVDDALLARFATEDAATRIFPNAHTRAPELAHSWNRALGQQPDQAGLSTVSAPRRRIPYTFPLEALPASFQADVDAFTARFTGMMVAKPMRGREGGERAGPWTRPPLLVTGGSRRRLRPWRPATLATRQFSIRQAVAALLASGFPMEAVTSLAVLVQPLENARRILEFYLERADGKIGSQRESISKVLALIARHHLALPPEEVETLVEWHRELTPRNQLEMGPKARECLRLLWQEERRAILLALPAHLMARARQDGLEPIERARLQRAACIIELLICCPMRIGNLHRLTLTRHLRYLDGPRRPTHIQLEGWETKGHEDHDFGIPRAAGEMLQTFIREGRQLLATPGNPYLFPGQNGEGPLSTDQLRAIFQDEVEGATGVRVHPHAMRGFASLIFLTSYPGQYEVLRRVLGHKDVETTRRYYTGLESIVAFEMVDEALLSQRRDSRLRGEAALAKMRPSRTRPRGR